MNTPTLLARLQNLVALGTRAASSLLSRCEPLPGFGFSETMSGAVTLEGEPERKLTFSLHAAVPRLRSYLDDGRTAISGEISIEGLARSAPLAGSLWIWPHRRIIRYEFTFATDAGERLRFAGQKDVRLLAFSRTMTTLPAELRSESGELRGRAEVYFALADLPAFVRSFHAVSNPPPAAVAASTA